MWAEAELARRTRKAYEQSRLRRAAARALAVAPIACLAFLQCCNTLSTCTAIVALVALVAVFHWRGQDYARGLKTGLMGGFAPFFLPLVATALGHACSQSSCLYMPTACLLGGVAGGLTFWAFGLRPRGDTRAFALAAVSVALACGAAGCIFAGLAGLAGMALGLAAGSAPLFVTQRA